MTIGQKMRQVKQGNSKANPKLQKHKHQKNGRITKKGMKLKTKTKEQVQALKKFLDIHHGKQWKRSELQQLSAEIQLSFKEVNKWLWDQQQRMKVEQLERDRHLLKSGSGTSCSKLFKVIGACGQETMASRKCNDMYLISQLGQACEEERNLIDPPKLFKVTKFDSYMSKNSHSMS